MSMNEAQQKLIDYLKSEIKFWENTNDISSPTHFSDIDEMIINADLSEKDEGIVTNAMKDIFAVLKNL